MIYRKCNGLRNQLLQRTGFSLLQKYTAMLSYLQLHTWLMFSGEKNGSKKRWNNKSNQYFFRRTRTQKNSSFFSSGKKKEFIGFVCQSSGLSSSSPLSLTRSIAINKKEKIEKERWKKKCLHVENWWKKGKVELWQHKV